MRFLPAVALAVVMLWVPVDGVAQAPDPWEGELFFLSDFSGIQYLSWSPDARSAWLHFRKMKLCKHLHACGVSCYVDVEP